jgi:hypothetical protein
MDLLGSIIAIGVLLAFVGTATIPAIISNRLDKKHHIKGTRY